MSLTATEFLSENYKDDERVCLGLNSHNIKSIFEMQCFALNLESENREDQYMSVSTLKPYANNRNLQNVDHIKFFAADLDIWHGNTRYKNWSKEEVLSIMDRDIFDEGKLMKPDYLFFTGRGFLLLWRVRLGSGKDITRYDAPNWIRVQKEISKVLSEFYVDSSCVTDYSRVFRIPGTINSKSGERVRFLRGERKGSTLTEWIKWFGLDKITEKQAWLIEKMNAKGCTPDRPITTRRQACDFISKNIEAFRQGIHPASDKQVHACISLADRFHVSLPDGFRDHSDVASAFISQFRKPTGANDTGAYVCCMKIIENFFREETHIVGKREKLLWVYRICHFALYENEEESLDAVLRLNDSLSHPLSYGEIIRTTKNATRPSYRDYICRHLSKAFGMPFSALKERYYRGAISTKRERRSYDKTRYMEKLCLSNQSTKKDKIAVRRDKVAQLRKEGYTQQAIADLLSVSLRTVKADCSALSYGAKNSNYINTCKATSSPSLPDACENKADWKELSKRIYPFFETVGKSSLTASVLSGSEVCRHLQAFAKGAEEQSVFFFGDGVFYQAYRVNHNSSDLVICQISVQKLSSRKNFNVLSSVLTNSFSESAENRFICHSPEKLSIVAGSHCVYYSESILGLFLLLSRLDKTGIVPGYLNVWTNICDHISRIVFSSLPVIDKCFELITAYNDSICDPA